VTEGLRQARSLFGKNRGIGHMLLLRWQLEGISNRVRFSVTGPTRPVLGRRGGAAPNRLSACEMPDLPATLRRTEGSSSHCTPSRRQRKTSRVEERMDKARVIT
jgi:hypothetical protein